MPNFKPLAAVLACACVAAGSVWAQRAPVEADTQKVEAPPTAPTKWLKMDYGPFLTTSIVRRDKAQPKKAPEIVAYKGIAIKLGDKGGVVFDTDLMCLSSGW